MEVFIKIMCFFKLYLLIQRLLMKLLEDGENGISPKSYNSGPRFKGLNNSLDLEMKKGKFGKKLLIFSFF